MTVSDNAVLKLTNVGKYYGTGAARVSALRDVSLTIHQKDFVVLCGPSGSGKTTLLNIMGILDTPDAGTMEFQGRAIGDLDQDMRARLRRDCLGFVFQAYNLIPVLTAVENTEFTLILRSVPRAERLQLAHQALRDVGLEGMEHRLPGELSGGQQQRVAIARAIVGQPVLILADEPTANLDSRTAEQLLELMVQLNTQRGVTFVFSTHDERVIRRGRRRIELCDGTIVGAHDAS